MTSPSFVLDYCSSHVRYGRTHVAHGNRIFADQDD